MNLRHKAVISAVSLWVGDCLRLAGACRPRCLTAALIQHGTTLGIGLPVNCLDHPKRPYDQLDAFFGGVGAVCYGDQQGCETAADPRRAGATALAGGA